MVENLLLFFGSLLLSSGFVLWVVDDYPEAVFLGAKHYGKIMFIGFFFLLISIVIHNFGDIYEFFYMLLNDSSRDYFISSDVINHLNNMGDEEKEIFLKNLYNIKK